MKPNEVLYNHFFNSDDNFTFIFPKVPREKA